MNDLPSAATAEMATVRVSQIENREEWWYRSNPETGLLMIQIIAGATDRVTIAVGRWRKKSRVVHPADGLR